MTFLKSLFEFLLFPVIFVFQSVGISFFRKREDRYPYHRTLLLLFPLLFSASLFAAGNSCPGIDEGTLSSDGDSISYEDSIKKSETNHRYHTVNIAGAGTVTIKIESTNNRYYQINIGTSCGNNDIGSHKGKDTYTFTYTTTSSQTIYISHNTDTFTNNKTRQFRVTIKYTQQGSSTWVPNQGGWINLDINKDFTLIYGGTGNAVRGDFIATGNTIMDGDKSTQYFAGSSPQMLHSDQEIDTYGTNNINTNSSSAPLKLPLGVKKDHIVWAGLFWQGQIHGNANQTSQVENQVAGWNSVHIKVPGGTIHEITASTANKDKTHSTYHYAHMRNGQYRFFYSAYVDITDIVKNSDLNSTNNIFTVGNLMATDGTDNHGDIYFNHINEPMGAWYDLRMGHFGGWSLIVVYNVDPQTAKDYPQQFPFKNISIYNGYDLFSFWTGHAGDVFETTLTLSGFRTPNSGIIDSKMLFFGGGGDYGMDHDTLAIEKGNAPGTFSDLTNNRNTGTQKFNGTYTDKNSDIISGKSYFQGMDLDIFDASSAMVHKQTSTKIKFGVVQQSGYIDQVFPQVIAFSTELYTPDLCYDYTYGQDGHYTIAPKTDEPYINDHFDISKPLDVKLYVRNRENSDVTLIHTFVHIKDINTTQATYRPESTQVTPPGSSTQNVPDSGREVSEYQDLNISIGSVKGLEYFYTYYSLDLKKNDIDMPINAYLQYNLSIDGVILGTQEIELKNLPICQDSGTYAPIYGSYNVVHPNQQKGDDPYYYYNLPTQVVKRPGHFLLEAMKNKDNNFNDSDTASDTTVRAASVEMIDADGFHFVEATCTDPKSIAISTKKVWTVIDSGEFAHDINQTALLNGGFWNQAIQNAAFRINYNIDDNNTFVLLSKESDNVYKLRNRAAGTTCGNTSEYAGDSISSHCPEQMDKEGIKECMECLYGIQTKKLCSRDNFSIRPEAYEITILDRNTTGTRKIANNTPAPNLLNLAAGYSYRFDVNTTDHLNGTATPRYHAKDINATLKWVHFSGENACNDTEDNRSAISFSDGYSGTDRLLNQIGKYTLQLRDTTWTKVDHIDAFMQHHVAPYFRGYLTYKDCIVDKNFVKQSSSIERSGCNISSNHKNIEPDYEKTFTDMNLTFYPYTFNHSGLLNSIGPATRTGSQTFVYINTPPTMNIDDKDMSYNMNGIFYASGKNGSHLSNFVKGCYADDVNMTLSFVYNSPDPASPGVPPATAQTPYLSYSLREVDATDTAIRPANGFDLETGTSSSNAQPFTIPQAKTYFAKDMNGSVKMNLGYNFKRDYNKTLNPRYIEFKDFNITYKTNPSGIYAEMSNNYQVIGEKSLDQNVTFIYGRAKTPRYFYDGITTNSVTTPVSMVAYCDQGPVNCSALYHIIPLEYTQSNEYNWYTVLGHNRNDGDGNIVLTIASTPANSAIVNPAAPNIVNITANGVDPNVVVRATRNVRPIDFRISFDPATDRWVIYNKDKNAIPNPFYGGRFIGTGGWTGYGSTGNVVGDDINTQKSRRLEW